MSQQVIYWTRSALSGLVKVIDAGPDRQLVVDGSVLSVYARDGDWTRARAEYWGEALEMARLSPRPSVLFVGLGGGTQLHLLREQVTPRHVTAIERDPVIVRLAQRWFGLGKVPGLEFLCAEAAVAVEALRRGRRHFDFVMEDCTYDETAERSIPLAVSLAGLVSRGGTLVVNRHRRPHAHRTADALAPYFARIELRRVRREADNILICATAPRRADVGLAPRQVGSPAEPLPRPLASPRLRRAGPGA